MSNNDLSMHTMDLVRKAEHDIASGRYVVALGLLNEALRTQPGNGYLAALIARTEGLLQQSVEQGVRESPDAHVPGGDAPEGRAFPLTSGRDFGVGLTAPQYVKGERELDLDSRIRILTTIATNLYERGSVEAAMQSLFKARLLDPLSRHVRACEEVLRPALDGISGGKAPRGAMLFPETSGTETRGNLSTYLERRSLTETTVTSGKRANEIARAISASLDEARLEALKRQKEHERRERELAMWREASRVNNGAASPRPRQPQVPVSGNARENQSAFFSKIKQTRPSR